MSSSDKVQCNKSFDSGYNKSSLFLLYGGMRKTLFVAPHPLDGVSSKSIGLKIGKAFYDLNKQELEYKDSSWRVKANFSGNQLFNLKMKLGTKVKGELRNNIQFGTDQGAFGSDSSKSTMSVGGMFHCGVGGVLATTRLKIFDDMAAEVFTDVKLAGATVGADLRLTAAGKYSGFLGASYGLPSVVPGLRNVHVGSIVSVPEMRPSIGLFAEASVPAVQKVVLGVEVLQAPQSILLGAEVALDSENSISAKVGDNGIAHISVIKRFKGLDLRMGVEANLKEASCGRFGARVTLK